MRYSKSKEFDQLVRQLVREGWRYWRGKRHGRLVPPKGYPVLTVAGSPSDWRALENFRHQVRHALLDASV